MFYKCRNFNQDLSNWIHYNEHNKIAMFAANSLSDCDDEYLYAIKNGEWNWEPNLNDVADY
jgi:hypothetical protein